MTTTYTVTVDDDAAGQRLDKFLAAQLPDISRARLQGLIEEGAVMRLPSSGGGWEGGRQTVQPSNKLVPASAPLLTSPQRLLTSPQRGEEFPRLNASYKIKPGETFTLAIPEVKTLDLTPATNITLDIIYEDDDILILNKPAGMTVHPAAGTRGDTLVHALLAHCGSSLSGIGGVARPGIVHRIDKDTSGLLAVAKNDAAHQALSAQLKDHSLARTYIAYAWTAPTPRTGTIEAPMARNPRDRKQMAVVEGGKHAVTHYETLEAYHIPGNLTPMASKIRCQLETGRTHQIRVHLNHIKCPLIGDPVYGLSTSTRLARMKSAGYRLSDESAALIQQLTRQALHAEALVLTHPRTGEEMTFTCPPPEDLMALESTLASLTIKG